MRVFCRGGSKREATPRACVCVCVCVTLGHMCVWRRTWVKGSRGAPGAMTTAPAALSVSQKSSQAWPVTTRLALTSSGGGAAEEKGNGGAEEQPG